LSISSAIGKRESDTDYSVVIRWFILVAVMLGNILQTLDYSMVNVAIPKMMGSLGATIDEINWVSTGYMMANVIVLPLTGWLSTVFGRKRYLAYSILLFTVASFCSGMSHSLEELIIFRIIQGAGGAALISTAQATLFEVFPMEQIGVAQGFYGFGVAMSPTLGPILGGWITDTYSWRWIFFVNIPIGILAAVMVWIFVQDSAYQTKGFGRMDFTGIALLAIGLGCMQTMLEKGERDDWFQSDFIVTLAVISAISLLIFIYWELHTESPAVNLRILKNRNFAAGTLFTVVYGFGMYGGTFVIPIFLQNIRHYTAEQTGAVFILGGLTAMVGMPLVGRLINYIPTRFLIFVGTWGFIIYLDMLHFLTNQTSANQFFWLVGFRGISMGFIFIPLTFITLTGLKGKDLANGSGLFNLMRQVGGSIGIAWLSTMVDNRISYHRSHLVNYANAYNPAFRFRMNRLIGLFESKGASYVMARMQALSMVDRSIQTQASVMAFGDTLLFVARIFFFALPLLLLFRKGVPRRMSKPSTE
jgi:DHA2 family multidrug resistance protein